MKTCRSILAVCALLALGMAQRPDPPPTPTATVTFERAVPPTNGAPNDPVKYKMILYSGDAELKAPDGTVPGDSDKRYEGWGQVVMGKGVCDVQEIRWPAAIDQLPPATTVPTGGGDPNAQAPIEQIRREERLAPPRRWSTARTRRVNLMPIQQGAGFKIDAKGIANSDIPIRPDDQWTQIETFTALTTETLVQLRTDTESDNTKGTVGVVGPGVLRLGVAGTGNGAFQKVHMEGRNAGNNMYLIRLRGE